MSPLFLWLMLLHEPLIALLDEPTSQLDVLTEEVILDIVKSLADQGSIVFFVAHKSFVLKIATKIIDMDALHSADRGNMPQAGTLEDQVTANESD